MKKTLVINSSVEFVIVGPIMQTDGIIIQSKGVNIDLIGAAYRLYHSEDTESLHNLLLLDSFALDCVWGKMIAPENINNQNRHYRMLFCWRKVPKKNVNSDLKFIPRIAKNKQLIKTEFDKFIENSYGVLKNYSLTPIDDDRIHVVGHSIIIWNIASLLLECAIDDNRRTW